jgi:hypothetical protein
MAIFNEILVGRFNRSLQKAFGIKGSPPVRQLAGEVQPAYQIQSGVENRYLESWNRFFLFSLFGASVGNNNGLQFRNPVGSNVIVVMEELRLSTNTAPDAISQTRTRFGATTTDLTNIFNAAGLDSRQGSPTSVPSSSMVISGFSPAANFAVTEASYQLAVANQDYSEILIEDNQWVILPGDTVRLTSLGVNEISRFSFKWRERYLEESERQ